jgi:hypothetical protein
MLGSHAQLLYLGYGGLMNINDETHFTFMLYL